MGFMYGLIRHAIRVNGRIMSSKVTVNTIGQMVANTLDNGPIIK